MIKKNTMIDNRLFVSNADHASQIDEALEYKMQLMNRQREKENLKKLNSELNGFETTKYINKVGK